MKVSLPWGSELNADAQPADADLKQRIVMGLMQRGVPQYHLLQFAVVSGEVIARGALGSAHDKWLCLECIRHTAGVLQLTDEIVIEPLGLAASTNVAT